MGRLKWLLWAAGAYGAYRLYHAEFWSAERFKDDVRVALEQALGRKVEIQGDASYSWTVIPGITVENVTIHEDPAHGLEPLLYANAIQARVRIGSLFTGRLALDKIVLDEPSVNVHRNTQGVNVTPLLERVLARRGSLEGPLPDIQIRNGRFNVVFDQRKSTLYLSKCDLDMTPIDDETFRVQFEGEPARTDRKAVGFGRFRTTGNVRLARGERETQVDVSLELDSTTFAEVAMLFEPRAIDWGGRIATRTRLKGPLSAVTVDGTLTFSSGRRELNPLRTSRVPLKFSGLINLRDQTLALDAGPKENPELAATVRLRARDLLRRPVWSALATFRDLPAAAVFGVARDMALVNVDPEAFGGKLTGAIGVTRETPQGMAALTSAASAESWNATLRVDGSNVDLVAALEQASVAGIQPLFTKAFPDGGPGLLRHLTSGRLTGKMTYAGRAGSAPVWAGEVKLSEAAVVVPGVAEPLAAGAMIEFEGDRLIAEELSGTFAKAGVALEGSYRYEGAKHSFALTSATADLGSLETLLTPALTGKAPLPPMEGALRVGRLLAGGLEIAGVRARIDQESWEVEAGPWRGVGTWEVKDGAPSYTARWRAENAPWQSGRADAGITMRTNGLGKSTLANLTLEGSFVARNAVFAPSSPAAQMTGSFGGPAKQLAFKNLALTAAGESYTGEGQSDAEGKLAITWTGAKGPRRMQGKIWPPGLESIP